MGYSYTRDHRRLLCCDSCGHAGGVRKVRCPAGWCSATALCGDCRKNPEVKSALKASHAEMDCAGSAARFDAERAAVAALHASGEYVFCASVYSDNTRENVRVWFRGADGDSKETVVAAALRDAFTSTTTYDEVVRARMSESLTRAYEQEAARDMVNEGLDGMVV